MFLFIYLFIYLFFLPVLDSGPSKVNAEGFKTMIHHWVIHTILKKSILILYINGAPSCKIINQNNGFANAGNNAVKFQTLTVKKKSI